MLGVILYAAAAGGLGYLVYSLLKQPVLSRVSMGPVIQESPAGEIEVKISEFYPVSVDGRRNNGMILELGLDPDGSIQSISTQHYPAAERSRSYTNQFDDQVQSAVVGKKLTDISLSQVGGASVTSRAFNSAIDRILSQM